MNSLPETLLAAKGERAAANSAHQNSAELLGAAHGRARRLKTWQDPLKSANSTPTPNLRTPTLWSTE